MSMHPETERRHLASLTPSQADAAMGRYHFLRPTLEEQIPLTQVARDAGVPMRTARRWLAAYRRDGLVGLARRPRADRAQPRGVSDDLCHVIEGLALQRPRRPLTAIHRLVADVADRQGWPVPSYRQVRAIVARLDPALVTLAHDGPRAYAETYDLLYRRTARHPNEIWQADHTPLPILLRGPDGAPVRPWLTLIEDDYSRAIAGYRLGLEAPTTLQTALALRDAIWRKDEPGWQICGIPAIFYTDHGSDFTSRHLEQVAADLKIQLVFSIPGVPRGRGKVERLFRTVEQQLLATLPGYAPPGNDQAAPVLTLAAFEERLRQWLLDHYHREPHSETGVAPVERWAASGFLPHLPESVEQLDLLLLTVPRTRRVQQDGIHVHSLRYLSTTLAAYVREEVVIRYDPADLAEIRVFHAGHFLCRAICAELAGETISLKDVVAARTQRRRALKQQIAAREALVETLLAVRRDEGGDMPEPSAPPSPRPTTLKRYIHE
jgi:putative transposase